LFFAFCSQRLETRRFERIFFPAQIRLSAFALSADPVLLAHAQVIILEQAGRKCELISPHNVR
jgi:hypothetical protein